MTALEKILMAGRVAHIDPHPLVPEVRDGRQPAIEALSKVCHQVGQRVAKVLVLTSPVSMSRHVDMLAKACVVVEQCTHRPALVPAQQSLDGGPTAIIE